MEITGKVAAAVGAAVAAYVVYGLVNIFTGDCQLGVKSKSIPKDWYQGKVVWVTGASSGIGRALALELNSLGAKVILSARRKVVLEEVRSQMSGAKGPGHVFILPFDAEDLDSLPEIAKAATRAFGRVDVLINNAGISTRAICKDSVVEVDYKLNKVDYLAPVVLTKCLLPDMCDRGSGAIVNVSSLAGKTGVVFRTAYCGAKAGLINFMNSLRLEVEHEGVSITNVCPGPVQTDVDRNALTADGNPSGKSDPMIKRGLTAERCAHLMLVAASNKVDELWVAKFPYLALFYLNQYMPSLHSIILKRSARKTVEAAKKTGSFDTL
eukprot:comp23769_c0_seq1/m.41187 comp23769_c0_seq1/g.41187  ORF comp23769_c0_seq1/g.41187 comp23769_c0_seq1/m.41187 type:complete len:324 (-) comp23769_c0_seq1:609-1580(-)